MVHSESGNLVGHGDNATVSALAGLPATTSPRATYKTKAQRSADGPSSNKDAGQSFGQAGVPSWATPEQTQSPQQAK